MSIEQQLSKAFKHNESSLQCPPSLDAQILADYEQAVSGKGRNDHMKKKAGLPKIAVIALIVAVLCGFAYGSKFLFSDSTSSLSYQFFSGDAFHLDLDKLENTRASLREVKAQLEPGEAALVYLPGIIKDMPVFGVASPHYIYDNAQWESILEERGITEQLPQSMLAGAYQFEAGTLNNPFYPYIDYDQEKIVEEMEAEKKSKNENETIWRKAEYTAMPSGISMYTSVYRNVSGSAINYSWQVYDDSVVKIDAYTSPDTEYEEYNVNGKKVHYTKNKQSLLADNGVLQSVMWMADKDGKTTIYSLESDSLDMTKETLIEAVRSLP
ncbi:hypothetical protein ACFP56_13720 [Paenibacillus septentrionalis]|uniref:DUF4367 domain-containing protein n=1 Tax=Paenibacillus septentrionalis TaxID=429342 RepID=A0ABW1V8D0_9BACL